MEDVIDFGDRYMQVKNNEIVDSGSLKGDLVRYIQVTAIYRSTTTILGKLCGDRNIRGDRYIQGRYIQVSL